MTEAEALELERHWGAPGPPPAEGWRCCYRCGEWWEPTARYWCMPHRLCRACKNDEKRGIWPHTRQWHRKNRWGPDGRLRRRCGICDEWKPLTSFYLILRNDEKRRTRHYYPRPLCIPCEIRRKGYRSMAEMRREVRERRRNERVAA